MIRAKNMLLYGIKYKIKFLEDKNMATFFAILFGVLFGIFAGAFAFFTLLLWLVKDDDREKGLKLLFKPKEHDDLY